CRDSAWLAVQALRHLGIAARFASGYLIQLTPDVPSLDGPSGPAHDFTDLHAWAEAYLPGAGWVGLDPTSGLLAGEGHLPLACSPHPVSAAPISGALEPCDVAFEHAMSVTRVYESARVTKPYSDQAWQHIEALGEAVDRRLQDGDVRLTMGGEPTFVSIDDMESAEWNTEAVGPTKRARADDLVRRLRERFASGAALHYGQGKWYPGEPLPRWSFRLIWRADGVPLWHEPERVARERADHAPTREQARAFAQGVATRLEVDDACVQPAFEDPLAVLKSESGLPENVDVHATKLDDAEERARLARALSRGLEQPVAFVLPVQAWQARDGGVRWTSERWSTRRGRLHLVPGDSPAGFRLPLQSLPWIDPVAHPYGVPADPTWPMAPLSPPAPRLQAFRQAGESPPAPAPARRPRPGAAAAGPVRTALVVEPRDGRLCVFLPPVGDAEEFVELVTAVEDTAAELEAPVHLEGYPPPPDPRLRTISVTPDPGVIEVNIHPAASWKEMVEHTTALYEEA
ncbi:MAG TPA: IMP dehydrogenase, partial [Alphaproteobacteria bacterium]|nr:IMP dehydrogenase [Alphaproteobacteria bacterium]